MQCRMLCLAVVAMALLLSDAEGQERRSRLFRDHTAATGFHFQRWSGDGDLAVSQISIPVTFVFTASKRLSFDLTTGSGFASLDRGTSSELSGLRDTKVRASYIVGNELALLTAGLSAPTGQTELTADEQLVSTYLSQNALRFRTPNFGQGLDWNAGLAAARKVGGLVFGVGVGYLHKGPFTPSEGGADYKPGDELTVTLGADMKILDDDGTLTIDAVYTAYGDDELSGTRIYESGDKVLLRGLIAFRRGRYFLRLHTVSRMKSESTSYAGPLPLTYGNGDQFEVGIAVDRGIASRARLGLAGDLKLYTANDFDRGEATMGGLGPRVTYQFSAGRYVVLSTKISSGMIDGDAVNGMEAGGRIVWRM